MFKLGEKNTVCEKKHCGTYWEVCFVRGLNSETLMNGGKWMMNSENHVLA